MKKVFYVLLFSICASLTITSCTEDEVTPTPELENGGGEISERP
jgi:hypothetical protein